jgi:hypothetical protein
MSPNSPGSSNFVEALKECLVAPVFVSSLQILLFVAGNEAQSTTSWI